MDNVLIGDSDTLYILGNTVDFGDEPMELIEDISMRANVYAVAGERDYLAARMLHGFDKMLKGGTTPDADYIAEMTAWVAEGGQTTLDGFRALDADAREGVLDYLSEMTLYEEATVKGKTYLLMSRGIANYDPDTDLEAWREHLQDYPASWINGYDADQRIEKERLYDLKAIPALYLLDKQKRVMAKDCTDVAYIEKLLSE